MAFLSDSKNTHSYFKTILTRRETFNCVSLQEGTEGSMRTSYPSTFLDQTQQLYVGDCVRRVTASGCAARSCRSRLDERVKFESLAKF